jgi:RNA polymerase sigma-70 factor (ECF subfamily)
MLMDTREQLTERFEEQRSHLRLVATRILGSTTEAEDALQEAWLRVRDQDLGSIENVQAWLTTVVARICLNALRSRTSRRESSSELLAHDPVVRLGDPITPAQELLCADSVGLALLVVLDALSPAERLAFVLHDVFGMSFSAIAEALGRSEAAVQQLASRARRRVQRSPEPDRDPMRQRRVVDAFFAAARDGNFDALLRVLHPEVELRIDGGKLRGEASRVLHGADEVASHTRTYSSLYPHLIPADVNGTAGALVMPHGRLFAVMGFTISSDVIVRIDALVDPERLTRLEGSLFPRSKL